MTYPGGDPGDHGVDVPHLLHEHGLRYAGRCHDLPPGLIEQTTTNNDGVIERHETMCPRTNYLGPLVPKINRPRNTMALH